MVYILRIDTNVINVKQAERLHNEIKDKIDKEDVLITLPDDASLEAFYEDGAIYELDRIESFIREIKDELLYKMPFREATKEERDSVNEYIKSISVDIGVSFYDNTKEDTK